MTLAATFLGGASGRLLPMSVPFRFFGAAAAYHVLAWAALAATGGAWAGFQGGLGLPLAALHLLTLGVFGMTAMGAGAQLMPVATRQAAIGADWLKAIWWLYTPGVGVLALGMAQGWTAALAAGSACVVIALAGWLALMARHLAGARGMPGVRAHAWAALVCLAVVLVTGGALVAWWSGAAAVPREMLVREHIVFAPFGFMGLLSAGLSSILVPMFVLSKAPPERAQLASLALLAAGLVLAGAPDGWTRAIAWTCGAAGVAVHLVLMRGAIAGGMRKDLGRSFAMVRFGWAALVVALLLAPAAWWGLIPHAAPLLAAAAMAWLASVLFGFLQRILPFLGALHAGAGRRRGPTASSLMHERALRIHSLAHPLAWCGVGAAIATGLPLIGAAAALAGLAGSVAFAVFYAHLVRRVRAPLDPGRSSP